MTGTQALVERLRLLDRHASAAPWQGYSEPDVNLPYSLFQGVPMQPGFGPLEPLTGYDVDLVAEMRNGLPVILAELERMAAEVEALREALGDFLAEADAGHVTVETDRKARQALSDRGRG